MELSLLWERTGCFMELSLVFNSARGQAVPSESTENCPLTHSWWVHWPLSEARGLNWYDSTKIEHKQQLFYTVLLFYQYCIIASCVCNYTLLVSLILMGLSNPVSITTKPVSTSPYLLSLQHVSTPGSFYGKHPYLSTKHNEGEKWELKAEAMLWISWVIEQ